jgi:putative glutamine amidotransferase
MQDKPLVLVTPSTEKKGVEFYDYSISVSQTYLDAITLAGGWPVVVPAATDEGLIRGLVERCDGVMLTGGDDIQPELYAKSLAPDLRATVKETDPVRDMLETLVVKEAFSQRKPLLAICRGHQILNVTLGGTLIVDIPKQVKTEINHSQLKNKDRVVHEVSLETESLLAGNLGKQVVEVNSSHHQAVNRVAEPLRVTGRSPDGIIEVMELKREEANLLPYLLAVQFHPERLVRGYPAYLELFRGFVSACAANRSERNQGARYEAQSAGGG